MFLVGAAFLAVGYAVAYYGIDVLAWSRSSVADQTRPVPIRYLLGVALPTNPPKDPFHPPFTINDADRANAVMALGGGTTPLPPGTVIAPPGGDTSAGPGTDPGGQVVIPVLPGEGGTVTAPIA